MSTPLKISVIGAGSATFSLGLVKDLCLTPNLSSRAEVLQDADFVISLAAVKSHYHQADMRAVIEKHGYYHRIGENLPGSWYNLNLMMEIVRDMEAICPDAWLIQSGNPVFTGCTLMTRNSDIKICGLCHGHYGVMEIAHTLGYPIENINELTWQAPGLNHNVWLTDFAYQGQDLYPILDEWIETKAEEYWATHEPIRTHDIQMSKGAIHQYKLYGQMPIGDTVRRGGWWYHTDIEANLANDPNASLIDELGATKTKEQQVPIIDALVNDVQGEFEVNVPNHGAIDGIPDDVVVEVPAIIDKRGIQPLRVGQLNPKIMYEHILPEWLQMERYLLAYESGDRTQLVWNALHADQTRSYDQAINMFEDVMNMPGHEEVNEFFQFNNGEGPLLLKKELK